MLLDEKEPSGENLDENPYNKTSPKWGKILVKGGAGLWPKLYPTDSEVIPSVWFSLLHSKVFEYLFSSAASQKYFFLRFQQYSDTQYILSHYPILDPKLNSLPILYSIPVFFNFEYQVITEYNSFQEITTKSIHTTRDSKFLSSHYIVYTLTSIGTLFYATTQ